MRTGRSFRIKLFKAFLFTAIVPLLSMAFFAYYNTSSLIETKLNTSVVDNINVLGRSIDSSLGSFKNMCDYIAINPDIQQVLKRGGYNSYEEKFQDVQKVYKITNNILATQQMDVPIFIVGNNLYSRFSTTDYFSPIYSDLNGDIFKQTDHAENGQLMYIQRRVDGKYRKDIVMSITKRINDVEKGDKLGYVIIDVYDDYFNNIFKNATLYKGSNIYVLNKKGTVITDLNYKNRTGFSFDKDYIKEVLDKEDSSFYCTMDGKKSIAYVHTLENTKLKLVETIPLSSINSDKNLIINTFLLVLLLTGIAVTVVSYFLSKSISKPVNKLSQLMHKVENGDLNVNFDIEGHDEIEALGRSFNKMVRELERLIDEVYVKQYLLKEAEFKALKAQVNPHFLYNTLESIKWMAKLKDDEGVVSMVTSLGKFLRYSISSKGDMVTVGEDLEQTLNYLNIQKTRYKDKFQVTVEVPEELKGKRILKLLLQPLVENAIVHGLEQKRGKGQLIIKGYVIENLLCFDIKDDGVGLGQSSSKGEGVGIENVDNRIKLHYGDSFGVELRAEEGYTCARIYLPIVEEEEENLD